MIDFRYHIVSIVAIFLALAVGLVLGTTTLNRVVLRDLNARVHGLTADKQQLRDQVSTLQGQTTRDDAFAAAAEKPLIANRLSGHRVVVVALPGAGNGLPNAMAQAVLDAGGAVSAQVALTDNYVDPAQSSRLDNLVTSLAPSGVTLPQGHASQRAAALLSAVLMAKATDHKPSGTEVAAVLTGLQDAKMLTIVGSNPAPGDLALVVAGAGPAAGATPTPSSQSGTDAILDLVGALDATGAGAVVVGPSSAAQQGVLSAVRSSGISDTVSTVDSAETPRGVVATVFALTAQLRGDAGAYGEASSSDQPLPSPAP